MNWKNLSDILNEYREYLESKMKDIMPSDWLLRDTFSVTFDIDDVYYEINFKAADYWIYANEGRGPGKWPPKEPIDNWISRKRVVPYSLKNGRVPTLEQLSFLIRRKITTKGTGNYDAYGNYAPNGVKFYDVSVEETQKFFESRIENAIANDINDELNEILGPFKGTVKI